MDLSKLWEENLLLRQVVTRLSVVLLVIFVTWLLFRLLTRWLRHSLRKNPARKQKTLISVLSNTVRALLMFLAVMIILEQLGVPTTSVIAVAGIGSVALGLGAQLLVTDVISGLFILAENQFNVDDQVDVGGISGTVESVSLRSTVVRGANGEQITVPNGEIRVVKNWSRQYNTITLTLPVAYETDLIGVLPQMRQRLHGFEANGLLETPEIQGISGFGEHAMNLLITCKVLPSARYRVERALRAQLKQICDELGVVLPYPRMDVYLRDQDHE